jgi:hypothetical protein
MTGVKKNSNISLEVAKGINKIIRYGRNDFEKI